MGVLSSKYPNVQAVEDALNKALESVNQTDFNAFKSNVYTKSETNDYTTEEKNKLSGISEGANKTVIDTTLSSISTNPVQNKVIKTSLDSKANSSDVYTKTESDSRFLDVEGTAKKAVADENGKNISESFATDKNDIALNRTTLGTQRKNLLKLYYPLGYEYTTATGTATWTFNNDYSVSMVANSQISSGVAIPISEVTLKKGTYLYSIEGYSTPNITHTQLYSLNADGSWTWLANLSAIENKITVTEETTYSFRAYRNNLVTVGVTETFYPMLRYADITDPAFEPYQPSLQEQIKVLEERISALEGGV